MGAFGPLAGLCRGGRQRKDATRYRLMSIQPWLQREGQADRHLETIIGMGMHGGFAAMQLCRRKVQMDAAMTASVHVGVQQWPQALQQGEQEDEGAAQGVAHRAQLNQFDTDPTRCRGGPQSSVVPPAESKALARHAEPPG